MIGWIKATEKIEANKCCKVAFSIGKYQEEVYCYLVEMDECHLLFGKLWQFNSDTRHSRRDNIDWLKNDGVRFTLFLLMSGSRLKVRLKLGASNKIANDLRWREFAADAEE